MKDFIIISMLFLLLGMNISQFATNRENNKEFAEIKRIIYSNSEIIYALKDRISRFTY